MSDIPRALFEVGEEVICTPALWYGAPFDAVVVDRKYADDVVCALTMDSLFPLNCYLLGDGNWWPEGALRKKPKPSTESFTELMRGLNKPIKVES